MEHLITNLTHLISEHPGDVEGWQVTCSCRWVSGAKPTKSEAERAGDSHVDACVQSPA
jgi:hypothetical protein